MPRTPFHRPTAIPGYEIVPAGETWRNAAACRDHPTLRPETWDDHPSDERERPEKRERRISAAIAVCKGCAVRLECLRDADLEWDSGVRGGVDLRTLTESKKRRGQSA